MQAIWNFETELTIFAYADVIYPIVCAPNSFPSYPLSKWGRGRGWGYETLKISTGIKYDNNYCL